MKQPTDPDDPDDNYEGEIPDPAEPGRGIFAGVSSQPTNQQ